MPDRADRDHDYLGNIDLGRFDDLGQLDSAVIPRLGLRTGTVVVGVISIVVGACSSDEGPSFVESDLPAVIETFTGMRGEVAGTIEVDGRSAEIHGTFSGADFDGGRGEITGEVPYEPAVPFHIRWRDGMVSTKRSEGVAHAAPWPRVLVTADSFGTSEAPVGIVMLADAVAPLFPPAILDQLRGDDPSSEAPGDEIDGHATTVLTFGYDLSVFKTTETTVSFTITDENELVRLTLRSEFEGSSVTLDYTVALVPGEADVTLPVVTATTAPPLAPTGDFTAVRTGTAGAAEWSVLRAPSRAGISCWRIETVPPIVVREPNVGADTRCLADPSTDDEAIDQVVSVLTSDGSADPAAAVFAVPDGSTDAKLGFFGGSVVDAASDGGVIVWVGQNDANPAYLEVTLPDGVALACGLGALSSSAELSDARLADVRLGLPWTCVEL